MQEGWVEGRQGVALRLIGLLWRTWFKVNWGSVLRLGSVHFGDVKGRGVVIDGEVCDVASTGRRENFRDGIFCSAALNMKFLHKAGTACKFACEGHGEIPRFSFSETRRFHPRWRLED